MGPFARVPADHDEVGAGAAEHEGGGSTDAARPTGDHGDGAVQVELVVGHGANVPYRPTVR